ncbi:MAG: DUF1573 domain-containing protein [Candidatus Spechtbacterales bacterium]
MKNKKRNLLLVAGIALFIGSLAGLVVISEEEETVILEYSDSVLLATHSSFDFGTINMKDGKVEHSFEVKNNGEEPVIITKAYTSCACTDAYIYDAGGKEYGKFVMPGHLGTSSANVVINPGDTAAVKAVFNPAAHGPAGVGLAQRVVYLETNSTQSPRMELSFEAVVTR